MECRIMPPMDNQRFYAIQRWIRHNTSAKITRPTADVLGDILLAHHPLCKNASDAWEAIMIVELEEARQAIRTNPGSGRVGTKG